MAPILPPNPHRVIPHSHPGSGWLFSYLFKSDTTVEENPDNYVLVLEDWSEAKSPTEPGCLSVISGQDEKGNASST